MVRNAIEVVIEQKRVYAYLSMINYGWYDDGDDPWSMAPNPSATKTIMVYKFQKSHLPQLEEYVRGYLVKHRDYIKWESLSQALGEYLSGLGFPWEYLENFLEKAGCAAKLISVKDVDI